MRTDRTLVYTAYLEDDAKPHKVLEEILQNDCQVAPAIKAQIITSWRGPNGPLQPAIVILCVLNDDGFIQSVKKVSKDLGKIMAVKSVVGSSMQTPEMDLYTMIAGDKEAFAMNWPEGAARPNFKKVKFNTSSRKSQVSMKGNFWQPDGVWCGWEKSGLYEMKIEQLPNEFLAYKTGCRGCSSAKLKLVTKGISSHICDRKPKLVLATWPHAADEGGSWMISVPKFF